VWLKPDGTTESLLGTAANYQFNFKWYFYDCGKHLVKEGMTNTEATNEIMRKAMRKFHLGWDECRADREEFHIEWDPANNPKHEKYYHCHVTDVEAYDQGRNYYSHKKPELQNGRNSWCGPNDWNNGFKDTPQSEFNWADHELKNHLSEISGISEEKAEQIRNDKYKYDPFPEESAGPFDPKIPVFDDLNAKRAPYRKNGQYWTYNHGSFDKKCMKSFRKALLKTQARLIIGTTRVMEKQGHHYGNVNHDLCQRRIPVKNGKYYRCDADGEVTALNMFGCVFENPKNGNTLIGEVPNPPEYKFKWHNYMCADFLSKKNNFEEKIDAVTFMFQQSYKQFRKAWDFCRYTPAVRDSMRNNDP